MPDEVKPMLATHVKAGKGTDVSLKKILGKTGLSRNQGAER